MLVLIGCFVLPSCNNTKEDISQASLKICSCFSDYSEDDPDKMSNTIKLLDSISEEINLDLIPKEKLIAQMQNDCPQHVELFNNSSK